MNPEDGVVEALLSLLPPPRHCKRCRVDPGHEAPLLVPVLGKLEQCKHGSLDAAVFTCNACGTVTTEPLRVEPKD